MTDSVYNLSLVQLIQCQGEGSVSAVYDNRDEGCKHQGGQEPVDTDFYELRISVGNEYRAILFTIDHDNIVQAEQILLLNGFMKKSTKDYKKEIQKAQHILDTYYEKED